MELGFASHSPSIHQTIGHVNLNVDTLDLDGVPVRVPWLEEETLSYVRRGRLDRAALCLAHCDAARLRSLVAWR